MGGPGTRTSAGGGPNIYFSSSPGGGSANFSSFGGFGDPNRIFEQFMRSSGGFGDDDDGFGASFSSSPLGGGGGGRQGSFSSRYGDKPNGRSKTPEATVLEKPIAFTLEE